MAVAFAAHHDEERGWIADGVPPTEPVPEGFEAPSLPEVRLRRVPEQGAPVPLSQRTLDKAYVTRLLSEYQDKARAADEAADALFTKTLALERDIQRQKERPLPGIPLYQHPQIVQSRNEWMRAREDEERYYFAWLNAINEYVGVPWEGRVEIVELAGWYTGIVRTGSSYDFCHHRDGTAAQFNSRLKGVLWLHPVMLRHAPQAE